MPASRAGSTVAAAAALLALAGCGDFGDLEEDRTSQDASERCTALAGTRIAQTAIGLPTGGVDVTSATLVRASDAGNANGEFCKVLAAIRPVDPTAPNIRIQVNLPTTWNGKALQRGGGGYNGTLVSALDQVPFGPPSAPTPLARGWVTLGSDSGHVGSATDGTFALSDEALANFGGDQLKKTHDAALSLMRTRYGKAPTRFYFAGNSQGGHEAFNVIQRWPQDYDGAIAIHPVYNFTMLQLDGNHLAKAVYGNGGAGWLNPAKIATLQDAVLTACDDLDGVADGVISNVEACQRSFVLSSLRCSGGTDSANSCLSDAQIGVVEAVNSRFDLGFSLASGMRSFARWPILEGADWSGLFGFGTRAVPSSPPTAVTDFGLHVLADPLIRFFVTKNPAIDSLTFDPSAHAARLLAVSTLIDANSADLSAFKTRGGKLLLMHGTVDSAVSPYNTIDYDERLVTQFTQTGADEFVRFYTVPGFGHGSGPFVAAWDSLGALEAWVERGAAPGTLVVTDTRTGNRSRTRPLCVYPSWPRYDGTGDVDSAASFSCVAP